MTLLNAPEFDLRRANRNRNILIGVAIAFVLLLMLTLAGYIAGHGWLFTNLNAEHKVNRFFDALEAKDYPKAFGIFNNDAEWQQHPDKYSGYPLARFTEDWTTESPVHGPITMHHVDISKTAGTGTFGSGIIVAVRLNGNHKVFMYVNRRDGTMSSSAPYILKYGDDN